MSGFTRGSRGLECDGVPLEAVAAAHGTPLYVYSAATLLDAYDAYDRALAAVPHRVCYALKANSASALLRLLAARGAGADIVSGGELQAALRAGFPAERIVFSGVGKSEAEIALGVRAGIGEFNAESEEEIVRIDRAAVAAGRRMRVTLRVNPDIDARSHPYISTGLLDNKFGVEIGRAFEILERVRSLPGILVTGVQCHIGSQVEALDALEQAAGSLAELSRELLQRGFPLETVDLGGGLAVDYDGRPTPTPAELVRRVLPAVLPLGLRLLLEPGRSIVARAGALLTRVLYVKDSARKGFVIVDAGMNDLLRPSLYGASHRIEPVHDSDGPTRAVDVVGPVCETGDFLARARELPALAPGALLAVLDAGAYGFSMASNYNLRPRPAEVLIEDGVPRLIRRRESFEDLVRSEL